MKTLYSLLLLVSCLFANAQKPTLWIYTDMSDPRDRRSGGHPQNDPDDIVSMASLLLTANEFNIESIVVSSTNRKGLTDPMPFINDVILSAYYHDLPALNKTIGGYQDSIHFQQSSITRGGQAIKFDPNKSYNDLSDLSTVAQLIKVANEKSVYVLSWGPLTESAMAVKHCLETNNTKALQNLTFISHWTKSSVAQGTPETPFKVANCNDDKAACTYMHEIALDNDLVSFIELGCVGQRGIVNGSGDFENFDAFNKSQLGQVFIKAKYYSNKPDQSDASTHWILQQELGLSVDDYPNNGSLPIDLEKQMVEKFHEAGIPIMNKLLERSNAAGTLNDPFPPAKIAEYFTYVYFKNNGYGLYAPYPCSYVLRDINKEAVKTESLNAGDHTLDFAEVEPGNYVVEVAVAGIKRNFSLEVNK